jgi:hypothetical protein
VHLQKSSQQISTFCTPYRNAPSRSAELGIVSKYNRQHQSQSTELGTGDWGVEKSIRV